MLQSHFRFKFQVLCFDNPMFMLRLGLGTNTTTLGLGKDHVLGNKYTFCLDQHGRRFPEFTPTISVFLSPQQMVNVGAQSWGQMPPPSPSSPYDSKLINMWTWYKTKSHMAFDTYTCEGVSGSQTRPLPTLFTSIWGGNVSGWESCAKTNEERMIRMLQMADLAKQTSEMPEIILHIRTNVTMKVINLQKISAYSTSRWE